MSAINALVPDSRLLTPYYKGSPETTLLHELKRIGRNWIACPSARDNGARYKFRITGGKCPTEITAKRVTANIDALSISRVLSKNTFKIKQ